VKMKVKRLSRQVKRLKQKVRSEQGSPRPPTGPAGGDLTGNYPDPALGDGVVDSANVANGSLRGGDINPETNIRLERFPAPGISSTTLRGGRLSTQFGGGMTFASTEIFPSLVELNDDEPGSASLDATDLTFEGLFSPFSPEPGQSQYGSMVTLAETEPFDDPPERSALLYVREDMGLTQLVARFADGDIEVLAQEGP
jgi:hypothetical protein